MASVHSLLNGSGLGCDATLKAKVSGGDRVTAGTRIAQLTAGTRIAQLLRTV